MNGPADGPPSWHPGGIESVPADREGLLSTIADVGYVVIDLLDRTEVDRLGQQMDEVVGHVETPFYASSAHGDRTTAVAVQEIVAATLSPAIDRVLGGYDIFLAAFLTKAPDTFGPVEFHQDWTYVDEREHRSLVVWVPLVRTDESNGALCVIPGSHRWTDDIRPSGVELPTRDMQHELGTMARTLFMEPGQAVVYDPRLIHGSWPNASASARPVVAAATAPAGAQLYHFQVVDGSELLGWQIGPTYFTEEEFASVPRDGIPVRPWSHYVTPELVRVRMGEAQARPAT